MESNDLGLLVSLDALLQEGSVTGGACAQMFAPFARLIMSHSCS